MICTGPSCDREACIKGLCRSHYMQTRRGGEMRPLVARRRTPRPTRRKSPVLPPEPPSAPIGDPERIARTNRTEHGPAAGDRTLGDVGPVPPTDPAILAKATARLATLGALDLADMLGLETP